MIQMIIVMNTTVRANDNIHQHPISSTQNHQMVILIKGTNYKAELNQHQIALVTCESKLITDVWDTFSLIFQFFLKSFYRAS